MKSKDIIIINHKSLLSRKEKLSVLSFLMMISLFSSFPILYISHYSLSEKRFCLTSGYGDKLTSYRPTLKINRQKSGSHYFMSHHDEKIKIRDIQKKDY